MAPFTREKFDVLQKVRTFPCISYYLPFQNDNTDARQGPIRLKKMIRATEDTLKEKGLRTPQIEKILEPVRELLDDALFWVHQQESLALFIDENGLQKLVLPICTDESVTIADRFMIRPLLPMLVQDGHYHMLWLSLSDPKLFRCTRHTMDEVVLTGLPESLKALLDTYEQEKQLSHHSGSGTTRQAGGGTIFHGGGSFRDSEKGRIEEYFRQIDSSLRDRLADDSSPIVLACVDYLDPIFRGISHDHRLVDGHLSGSPENIKKESLLEAGWNLVSPHFEQAKTRALENCAKLLGTPRIIEDIRLILPAALHSQIDTLFITSSVQAWGRTDPTTGRVVVVEDRPPEFGEEELFDQAAMHTLQHGGQVFILEPDEMPEQADSMAILRYDFIPPPA